MFKNYTKKIAVVLNVLLGVQLVLLGLTGNANTAFASDDLIKPEITSITYAEEGATLTSGHFVVDATKADDEDLQEIEVSVSEAAKLTAAFLDISEEFDFESAGLEVINLEEVLGEPITLEFLREIASELGTVNVDLELVDLFGNTSRYVLVVMVKDVVSPEITNLSFAGVSGSFDKLANKYTVNLNGSDAENVPNSSFDFTLSEDSKIEVTAPFAYVEDFLAGAVELPIDVAAGRLVTLEEIKALAIDGVIALDFYLEDESGNINKYTLDVLIDVAAPTVDASTLPNPVNDVNKIKSIELKGDEAIRVLNSGLVGPIVTVSQGEVSEDFIPSQKDPNTISIDLPLETFAGATPLVVKATIVDLWGNVSEKNTWEITVDAQVPEKVTDLSAIINEDGNVLLTWKNPIGGGDYKEIRIFRNGETAPIATLPIGATSYIDTSVEKGQTYYYDVAIVDEAGNMSEVPRASVSTPAPVVAAVASDTVVLTPKKAETKPAEQEVKAETTENKVEENKEEDNKLPLWGLIILLVLAAVGGYLYYSKDGKEVNKPIAQKTSAAAKPKKAALKKKSKK